MRPEEPKRNSRGRFLTGLLSGGLIVMLLTGAFTMFSANAHSGAWRHGRGHHGFGHPGFGDASTAGERAGAFTDWILSRIVTTRVEVEGRDEVATLARRFNRTADRIERLVTSQRSILAGASHELRSPLARIRVTIEFYPRMYARSSKLV